MIRTRYRLLIILTGVFLWFIMANVALAKVEVSDLDELKKELRSSSKSTIYIASNISVKETLISNGNKILVGDGGGLKRSISGEKAFGGSLIKVKSGSLSLRGIRIDGGSSSLNGGLYGYLIDVCAGQLVIRDGSTLSSNKNSSYAADGGGGVRVRKGATLAMYGGSITNNTCVSGGGGVRIDSGGAFYMKGGTISGNTCIGKSKVAGFEGRGGGIYNVGTCVITGGSVSSNTVKAYSASGRHYGGVGGGICNCGVCQISGGSISSNHAGVAGGGIYALSGSLKMHAGSYTSNKADDGSDIAFFGGNLSMSGSIRTGEIWISSGKTLQLGDKFKASSKIRIVPNSFKNGLKIASGAGVSTGLKVFVLGGATKYKKEYSFHLSDGSLKLKKRSKVSPTPYPTATHNTHSYSGVASSSTYKPVQTSHRPPVATYKPIATIDPMSIIPTAKPRNYTSSPMASSIPVITTIPTESATPIISSIPTISATPTDIVSTTPVSSVYSSPSVKPTLDPKEEVVRSTYTTYYFSRESIRRLKQNPLVKDTHGTIRWIEKFTELLKQYMKY